MELWRVLDGLWPMPISQTRDRISRYVADVKELGLINETEAKALLDSNMRWREARLREMEGSL